MPNKPISNYSASSASAADADDHAKGQNAADMELSRIESWTSPNFAGGGRQQLQQDESFGYREKRGKPYSDTEIRPEKPEILRYLERMHYDSPEWRRDAGIKNRGLGVREVDDPNVSKQKQDSLPDYGK